MITALVSLVVVAILVMIMLNGDTLEQSQYPALDDYYQNTYREDIDFSMPIKGYPVVNDYDIGYTEWQVEQAKKSMS